VSSSRKARIDLRSPHASVEFSLLDSSLQEVARGVGKLEKRVDPGLYQLEVRAGPQVESQLLRLGAGEVHRDLSVSLAFPSAAPLEGTTTSREVQQQAAFAGSERVAVEAGPPSGLVVVVRNVRGQDKTPLNKTTTRRLTLLNNRLRPVANFAPNWKITPSEGWASWSGRLEPGGYVLRSKYRSSSRTPEATIDQSIWLSRDWQTLVFIPNSSIGPASGSASIHMTRLTERWIPGWDPDSQESGSALELALWGLREGRSVIPDNLLRLLLGSKFSNAMLGIVGAHSLLLEPRFDAPRFDTVLKNLRSLVPDHPDVAALSWLGVEAKRGSRPKRKSPPFPLIEVTWPPMLVASYAGLVRLDAVTRGGLVPGSLAEQIAANLVVRGVWTSWRSVARGSSAPRARTPRRRVSARGERAAANTAGKRSAGKTARRCSASKARRVPAAADPASERVEVYVDEVRRAHGVETRGEAVKVSGHDQISVATGLPLAAVERALEGLGESWLRS
jgi:hypothetical protein